MQASNAEYENDKSGVAARREVAGPTRQPQIGEVVRDAIDQAQEIARDTVTLGRLEAEHVIALAKDEAKTAIAHAKIEAHLLASKARVEGRDLLSRAAFGALTVAIGTLGVGFLCVAIFLGLGAIIPSLAIRFGIFAAVFLAVSTITARQVKKRGRVSVQHSDERLRHLAPMHHIDDEV